MEVSLLDLVILGTYVDDKLSWYDHYEVNMHLVSSL